MMKLVTPGIFIIIDMVVGEFSAYCGSFGGVGPGGALVIPEAVLGQDPVRFDLVVEPGFRSIRPAGCDQTATLIE